jgi:hypothetical protein
MSAFLPTKRLALAVALGVCATGFLPATGSATAARPAKGGIYADCSPHCQVVVVISKTGRRIARIGARTRCNAVVENPPGHIEIHKGESLLR